MKTPSIFLAPFFLLFAFGNTAWVVFDSNFKLVYNNDTYYMKPENPVSGHGIMATAIRHGESNECSLFIVAASSSNGWATRFEINVEHTHLWTDTPTHIAFNYLSPNVCTNSTRWIVRRLPEKQAVMLDDSEHLLQSSIFKIMPYGPEINTYKLVYCDSSASDECENIGLHVDNDHTFLVVTKNGEPPLKFKFEKAFEPLITSHLSMMV